MKKLAIFALAAVASSSFAQLYSNQSSNASIAQLNAVSTALSGAAAPAGSYWSEVQNSSPTESNTSAGFSVHTGFRLADDFTVTAPAWNVSSISVYAYATGTTAPWLTGGNLKIWNAAPNASGASVVYDSGALTAGQIGQTTQINTASGVGEIYRIFNTVAPAPGSVVGTTRKIYQFTFNVGSLNLASGTYWIDYQLLRGTATVFAPSTTHAGLRGVSGANGLQQNGTTWAAMIDSGNPATAPDVAQEVPFLVNGQAVPEPGTMIALGAGLAAVAARRRRKA